MTSVRLPPGYSDTLRRTSNLLRATRLERGLTQEQLAERAGVHRNTIQNVEADRFTHRPAAFRIDVLFAIAHALDIPMEALFS